MELVYLFSCAPEYVPYSEGEGPPILPRSEAEWQERRQELIACQRRIARAYTSLETIRAMTWNGSTYALSDAEMKGIVRNGADYLEDYVDELLQAERRRAPSSGSGTLSREGTP